MTTEARTAALAGACAGLAVSGMLTLSRVPASADLLVPRTVFHPLFGAVMKAQASPVLRGAASWLAILLTLAAVVLALRAWSAQVRERKAGLLAVLGTLAGLAVLAAAARSSVAGLLDVLQNAWFPPESLDIREPLAAFLLAGVPVCLAVRAGLSASYAALAKGSWVQPSLWLTSTAACWLASQAAVSAYGGGSTLADAAGIRSGTGGSIHLLVLTEGKAPSHETVEVPLDMPGDVAATEESLALLERFADLRSVHRQAALRLAYTGRALLADAEATRKAAFAAARAGDPLARLLLLGSLAHAPATAGNRELLRGLADEGRWRAGPHAAFLLAKAFARFGDLKAAEHWLGKASLGASGIPAGLLGRPKTARPAAVRGRFVLEGSGRDLGKGLRAALYARERTEPFELSAMTLAASTVLGSKGGFEFKDMPAGDYALVLVLGARRPGRDLRVLGHKGDIRVEGRDVSLAPITLRF